MTKRERVETTYRLGTPDRPPFVPAIYEHKGRLIGQSPSAICRNPDLLHAALAREVSTYDPDMLVVGVDVYNVEAEALGCEVVYFEDTNDVPGIVRPLIEQPLDLGRLGVPDPERDGRMPMYLEVAEAVQRENGAEMIIRGAVTGPFSMASELLGAEPLLMAGIEDPEFVRALLDFTGSVTVAFGAAFASRGVEPIIFDSRATPRLVSPRLFRQLVLPVYRDLVIPQLRKAGACRVPLIIGGNTTSILDDLIATGASQLLCDHGADLDKFRRACIAARVPFRVSVDARLVHSGPVEEIRRRSQAILDACRNDPGFLFGCGVIAYDCDPAHVQALREALEAAPASG